MQENLWKKYMNSISKHVYIEKLDHIVSKFNNAYNRLKPVDVKSGTYFDFRRKVNGEGLNFKIGDIVTTSKCKNNFPKGSV